MNDDFNAMLSEFAAKGRSGSGATIKAAIRIFEEHTAEALDLTLSEAAKLIDHRGRSWRSAMLGIGDALDSHLDKARQLLAYPLNIGNRGGRFDDAASKAADGLIEEAASRLRTRVADFSEGWTAPVPKLWKDRHPVWYALIFLIVGAVAKEAIDQIIPLLPNFRG